MRETVPAVDYRQAGDIAILTIDNPPVNALSLAVREGLMQALERAAAADAVRALVIAGARGSFAAGADLKEVASGVVLTAPITRDVQARIESLHKPVVAAISGVALGGGFELALSCHWRVAARDARVGLPEVKIGLIPGAGGTQRFTRLAGPQAALEAITSGAQLPAARALELQLVDVVADDALQAACDYAHQVLTLAAARCASPATPRSTSPASTRRSSAPFAPSSPARRAGSSRRGASSMPSRRPARGPRTRRSVSSASTSSNAATARSAPRSCTCSSPSARRAASPGSGRTSARCPSAALRWSARAPWAAASP